MKNKNIFKFIGIHFFFISTLLIGLYFDEDFAGGARYDYFIHKVAVQGFLDNFNYSFFNYDQFGNTHSPVFILFLSLLIENNEIFGRILYILISSLLPITIFLILKIKFKKNDLLLFFLSHLVLLSPYYRAVAIWPGDETISLIFLSCSIYFYLKFQIKNSFQSRLQFMLLNIFCLALTCYFRPVYCFFGIFFFYEFFKNFNQRLFLYYLLLNFILSFPALYYIFYLDVNFFKSSIAGFNLINSFTLAYLTIFFYILPFIIIYRNKINLLEINFMDFLILLIFSILVIFFFDYKLSTGGGFFYYLSNILFKNNIIIYVIFPFAFYFTNNFLQTKKLNNFLLVCVLIMLEIDGQFYVETYDPLLLILIFSLFKINFNELFFNNLLTRNTKILSTFILFILILKSFQTQLSIIIE